MITEIENDRIYTFGYSPAAVEMMERRSAKAHAAFLLDRLEPGMRVLDLGCGPGSITVGFAPAVAPGQVIGLDIEASQVELGQQLAESQGLTNCHFRVGSVLDLPFDAESFDVAYGHAILIQFDTLTDVFAELMRVLKPGGLVGFRELDMGTNLYHSQDSAVYAVMNTIRRAVFHNGGNPDIGRSLPGLLAETGFEILSTNAVYVCPTTSEAKQKQCMSLRRLWQEAEFPQQAQDLGWITAGERSAIAENLTNEAMDPGSFNAMTHVEVLARKPH